MNFKYFGNAAGKLTAASGTSGPDALDVWGKKQRKDCF